MWRQGSGQTLPRQSAKLMRHTFLKQLDYGNACRQPGRDPRLGPV